VDQPPPHVAGGERSRGRRERREEGIEGVIIRRFLHAAVVVVVVVGISEVGGMDTARDEPWAAAWHCRPPGAGHSCPRSDVPHRCRDADHPPSHIDIWGTIHHLTLVFGVLGDGSSVTVVTTPYSWVRLRPPRVCCRPRWGRRALTASVLLHHRRIAVGPDRQQCQRPERPDLQQCQQQCRPAHRHRPRPSRSSFSSSPWQS
jgi:hypothetical protein